LNIFCSADVLTTAFKAMEIVINSMNLRIFPDRMKNSLVSNKSLLRWLELYLYTRADWLDGMVAIQTTSGDSGCWLLDGVERQQP
jgi:hypothetical protein